MTRKRSGLHKPVEAIFTRAVMPEEVRPGGAEPSVHLTNEQAPKTTQPKQPRPKRPRPKKASTRSPQVPQTQVQLPLQRPPHGKAGHPKASLGGILRAIFGWLRSR